MSRSVWKGPFVDPSLLKKVEKLKNQSNPTPIKTWSRKSTIIPEFIGISFLIYNGKKFIPIKISEEMVGHKLGEFSLRLLILTLLITPLTQISSLRNLQILRRMVGLFPY